MSKFSSFVVCNIPLQSLEMKYKLKCPGTEMEQTLALVN